MDHRYDAVRSEALNLTPGERATLADELLASIGTTSDSAIEESWIVEALRRREAARKDPSRLIDGEEVFRQARNAIRR